MPYDNLTDATSVGKLIPETVSTEILKNVPQESAALNLFRRVPLSTRTVRQPVLTALPMAYFVNGDTGLKQTTEMAWSDKTFTVEELAVIMPVPQNVVDDLSFDIWAEAKPLITEAFGRAVDNAIFFGVSKPSSWPAAIVPGAVAATNYVDLASGDIAGAGWSAKYIDKVSDLWSMVEADGYDVNGMVMPRTQKGRLRKLRDGNGQRLFDISNNSYEGVPIEFRMDGLWPTGSGATSMIAGDFTRGVVGIRKDMTFEIFKEGVIQDNTGAIIYNLLQQDMIAMRVTFRLAWQVANPINYNNTNESTRYPFAVLREP